MNHAESKPVYAANFGSINFVGLLDHLLTNGKITDVLMFDNFSFGIFGNIVICKMEKFSEMAKKIAEVKKEFDKGNRFPWLAFINENFYVKA